MQRRVVKLLAAIGVVLVLAGCAEQPHREICARILEALLPPDEAPRIVAAEHDKDYFNDVALKFRAAGDGRDRELVCRFAEATGQRFSLRAVELDGAPLSQIRLFLLHRWLGQPIPVELLEPAAPVRWGPALHWAYFLQQALNGIVYGMVIALVAVGYTLVYGITRHIQFAYGELLTIGAMATAIAYVALSTAGWANLASVLGLGLPLVLFYAALNGWTIERVVFRPMLHAPTQTPLIAAIGLSIFLQEFVRLSQGARARWMPPLVGGRLELFTAAGFTVSLTHMQVVVVALAVALTAAQGWVLARTDYGRRYRAAADDPRMAALLGVDVHAVVAATYAAGAALAAMAGAAMLMRYGEAGAMLGVVFGFKALTAAILGGIGSFAGALAGGLLIGLTEALWAGYLNAAYRDAAVFAVLVIVLVFRPAGLFGRDEPFMPGAGGGAPGSALRSHPSAPFPD